MKNERTEIVRAGKRIYERGLVAGTWGNISRRLEDDETKFAITPSGMDYEDTQEEDIVVLNLDGEKVKGEREPSTEFHLHQHIYSSREDTNAIVHTHSTFASAVSCTRESIPPLVEDMVQIVGGRIETADYKLPGTEELAESAVEALGDKRAALLANHGVVSLGEDLEEAMKVSEIVEKSAKIFLLANLSGEIHELSDAEVKKMRDLYEDYGQS